MAQVDLYGAPTSGYEPVAPPVKMGQADAGYAQVATAPDGVPVYQNGGNYYTQNADKSYTQQFQGGTPDWLTPKSSTGFNWWNGRTSDTNQIGSWLSSIANQQGVNPSVSRDPGYWTRRINETGGLGQDNSQYWMGLAQRPEGAPEGGGQPGYGGTGVFNDPATQQYEQLLNGLIGKLNTPYTPPSFQQSIDQMNAYLKQLNGPAFTPQQQDILQTQQLDPLERQRSAQKQQVMERLGSRGITPTSGITEQALENTDNSFNTLRANAQAGIASNQVGVQRQNAATAAQLAPQIAQMEAGNYGQNLGYQTQAANLASIIPQLAWSRLQGAGSQIQPLVPSALMEMQNRYQQQGYGQSADFTNGLTQLLMQLFGGGAFG